MPDNGVELAANRGSVQKMVSLLLRQAGLQAIGTSKVTDADFSFHQDFHHATENRSVLRKSSYQSETGSGVA